MTGLRSDDDPDSEDCAEGWKGLARCTPAKAWAFGVGLPLALVTYGVICLKTHSALFLIGNQRRSLWQIINDTAHFNLASFHGPAAIGLGTAYLGLGLFLHFYVFWSWRERFEKYAQVGMLAAVLAVAEGVLYFVIHAIVGSGSF